MPNRSTDDQNSLQGLYERIGRNENDIENIKKHIDKSEENNDRRFNKLEESNVSLERLTVMMELQTEMNKQQNEQMARMSEEQARQSDKMNETLNNVNSNLTLLNSGQAQMQTRVTEIEKALDENKIDLAAIGKKVAIGLILAVVATVIYKSTGITIKF